MAKVIKMSLASASIRNAINQLDAYRNSLPTKTDMLCNRLAQRIAAYAQEGFASAVADTALYRESGTTTVISRTASVSVTVEPTGQSLYIVAASGEDAVWAEFGAGVYYNGSAGTSPHPKGAELGFVIGGYGKGNGRLETWGYFNGDDIVLTHGTPASMPLYNALVRARGEIAEVAREVFSL